MPILQPVARLRPTVAAKLLTVADLCAKRRVRRLALFGSAATDRFDPRGSYLNFLAAFESMRPREHIESYFGLMEDLQHLLGIPVDLVEAGANRNSPSTFWAPPPGRGRKRQ